MKIKTTEMDYEKVINLPKEKRKRPKKPNMFFRMLLKALSAGELKKVNFECNSIGYERLGKDEPALILMNHSSFIDLKIAATVLYPRPFNIVCTSDGFVGKNALMRSIGCIPTNKFVTDTRLVADMRYALEKLHSSVLLFPEASYSFDGTATPLPESLGKCLKLLGVPVIMIRTYGAFSRDPLYNGLRLRKVDVSCDIEYLFSKEDIRSLDAEELNARLTEKFTFDNFKWQRENSVHITEDFRAEGLNRVLYKCPHCMKEGEMESSGISVRCKACHKEYELTELGLLKAVDGETEFSSVPEWYKWERNEVANEIERGDYLLDVPVDIMMLVDTKSIYKVGEGRLKHDKDGFLLTGCDGRLEYRQKPTACYSVYSDYYWYEIGDMICIGDNNALYYCFPKNSGDVAAKTRLAAEEMYKLEKQRLKTTSNV